MAKTIGLGQKGRAARVVSSSEVTPARPAARRGRKVQEPKPE